LGKVSKRFPSFTTKRYRPKKTERTTRNVKKTRGRRIAL